MRLSLSACFLALAPLVLAESDILKLTADDFDSTLANHPLILVEFFAPWCGHCKALAPHYEEAATALKAKNIVLASVDCVDHPDLCQAKGVAGYPTLKVHKDGDTKEYNGPRSAEGIISYMVKQSLPAVSTLTSENHEEFQKSDKFVIVAYLPSATAAPASEFSAVAEKYRDDYPFGLVTDSALAESLGIKPPALVVYRQFDEPRIEYPHPIVSATVKDFENWFAENRIPLIDEVNGDNYALYAESEMPLAYLFLDASHEDKDSLIAAIKPVAQKHKGKVNFVWIDAIKFSEHAKSLNLQEPKWPSFVIQNLQDQLKYPVDQSQDITAEVVDSWTEQYIAGKLEPSLKSQAIPTTQGDVHELVGKTIDGVVFDDSKDVFIEFYATWCGHCKRLAPTWQTLGETFAPLKDTVVIAKIDAAENDLPPSFPFRVSGFPTLKFKRAGTRDFIDYDGDRSLESLIDFVKANAKNPVVLPERVKTEETETGTQTPFEKVSELVADKVETEAHDEL